MSIVTPAVILTQDNYPGGTVTVLVPSKVVVVEMGA